MNSSDVLAFACREAVGAVFLWAAWAKLRAFGAFADGLARAFSGRSARIIAYSVISVESAVGVLLAAQVLTRVAAIVAAVVLSFFTAFLVLNVARRSVIPCNCFGMGSGRAIGVVDVFRNVGLVALASYGAVHPAGLSAVWVAAAVARTAGDLAQHPSGLVIVAVLAAQTFAIGMMLRSVPSKNARLDVARQPRLELPVNFRVPNFVLENRHGAAETFLDIVSRSSKTLFIFVGAACHDCVTMLREIADVEPRRLAAVVLVVNGSGPVDDEVQRFPNVLLEEDPSLALFFGMVRTPSSLLFDREGRVISAVQAGASDVARQLRIFVNSIEPQVGQGTRLEPVGAILTTAPEG